MIPKSIKFVAAMALMVLCMRPLAALDHPGITGRTLSPGRFTLVQNSRPVPSIYVDEAENSAVIIAAKNLCKDFGRVTGVDARMGRAPAMIVAGTIDGPTLRPLIKADLVKVEGLVGCREKYEISFVKSPFNGCDEALVVAGSDRRGAAYGIYELSEQLGVSPWYDWADAPVRRSESLAIARGVYTAGEPAVRLRGIFLNDEAPCLTTWVKNTYGTDYGGHEFYARVGELIMRLRGNFLWPAMWCWAFYADDPENSATMDAMGVIMGTSHHEPMGRNHQEWVRRRGSSGAWNYATNKSVLDEFFAAGVRRMKSTEDVLTIGMRGDGDEAMDGNGDIELMNRIIASQRAIIERETGRPASEVPQVWALYKEVLDYYDRGMRPPEDVTLLLCDDNWGNVRRLPDESERYRAGGWGMYYHVDYVGAPRNSKFLNVTSVASMWEQMSLAYEYGVDRLWILNVGDLKPMEYPITLFMEMAWSPGKYTPANLREFTYRFVERMFGSREARTAARILETTSRWAARVTPEMLDKDTFDLESGEWAKVAADYAILAADAEAQQVRLPAAAKAAHSQLVLFPVRVMANLYQMYYAQAMNHALAAGEAPPTPEREAEINYWADRVEAAFKRHRAICDDYNNALSGGKWRGFANQKLIGYKSWSDNFPQDECPAVKRVGSAAAVEDAVQRSAAILAVKEPRVYSVARTKSYDANMGENWWMRRHEATLKAIADARTGADLPEYDLVLAGDSITHRWERHGKAAYVQVTNELKVLNLGFGADNVRNLLWRIRSGELDGYRAKAVQLMIGTNNGTGEPPEETAAQIRAAVREIRARQPGARLLLCPILPRGNPDSVERGKNDAVNDLLKPLADGKNIIWTDWSGFFTLADGRLRPDLQDDGLHPNAKGYAAWAKVALPVWKAAADKAADVDKALSEVRVRADATVKPAAAPRRGARKAKTSDKSYVALGAEEYVRAEAPAGFRWQFIPGLGRGTGAMEVFPRLEPPEGAELVYELEVPKGATSATVTVVTRSTLAFARPAGHRFTVSFAGSEPREVNFNSRLNEDAGNIYSVFYPTVARRVVSSKVEFGGLDAGGGSASLVLAPLDQAVAFEGIVVDFGGAPRQYLLGLRP